MSITFELVPAAEDHAYAQKHLEGMASAYTSVGYESLIPKLEVLTKSDAQLLTVCHDGKPMAGIRFHLRANGILPSQLHLGAGLVRGFVDAFHEGGTPVAEGAGTWVEWSKRGRKLSGYLLAACAPAGVAVGAKMLVGSCAEPVVPYYQQAGAKFITDHPLLDKPLPGLTSFFFYRWLPSPERPLEQLFEEIAFQGAEEFRKNMRLSPKTAETLMSLWDRQTAPAEVRHAA